MARAIPEEPNIAMAGETPKLCDWNLRDFPEDLKLECQQLRLAEQRLTGEKIRDSDTAAKLIRLGIKCLENEQVLNSSRYGKLESDRRAKNRAPRSVQSHPGKSRES